METLHFLTNKKIKSAVSTKSFNQKSFYQILKWGLIKSMSLRSSWCSDLGLALIQTREQCDRWGEIGFWYLGNKRPLKNGKLDLERPSK